MMVLCAVKFDFFFFLPSAYLFLFIYLPLKREKYLKGLDDFFFFFGNAI